ncbi:MAG: hypothetical protein ACLTWK_00270 [Eisenbergiella sp.]
MSNNYTIYEHIIGLPDFLDTRMIELEEYLSKYSTDEAEKFIEKYVSSVDKFGRNRRLCTCGGKING